MRRAYFSFCVLIPLAAQAAPAPTVHAIEAQIRAEGAAKAVATLDAAHQMDAVLDRIGKGGSEWITLAARIAPGTDGASAEGLTIVLAQALPVNPSAVLHVLTIGGKGILDVGQVCSTPFIDTTPAANAEYDKRTIRAVSRVAASQLTVKRDACLARLKS